jgi:hypothetical protein
MNYSTSGIKNCNINYCDSHTALSIKDYGVVKDYEHNSLIFNDIAIRSPYAVISDMTYSKEDDKYTFCLSPDKYSDQLILELSDSCKPVKNSIYESHYVCDNKYWIDFEGQKTYSIYNKIFIDTKDYVISEKPVCFNSVGSLNCVTDSLFFSVTEQQPQVYKNASMECFYNPRPAFSDKMNWLCLINESEIFSCNSYVKIEDRTIQINPPRENIELYGFIDSFKSQNGLVNVYFSKENLRVSDEYNYQFIVKCSYNHTIISYNASVSPVYVAPVVFVDRLLWAKDNAGFVIGAVIIVVLIILMLIGFGAIILK